EFFLKSSAIDLSRGFAYFGTSDTPFPGTIVKVKLSDFSENESLTMNAGENVVNSAALDPVGGFGYFGTDCWNCANPTGNIVKVRLSDFARVGSLVVNLKENQLASAVIAPVGGFAYFGTDCFNLCSLPGTIVKVRLSDFTINATLSLNPGENGLSAAVI